jgi:hypothetical protein
VPRSRLPLVRGACRVLPSQGDGRGAALDITVSAGEQSPVGGGANRCASGWFSPTS